MIVTLVNQKGGVGKTTLAVNIASCRYLLGETVLVIDADPQGSLLQWRSIAGADQFDVEHRPSNRLQRDLRSRIRKYDHVVIDAPPGMNAIARAALAVADIAVVPVGPSPLDIWSSRETLALLEATARRNRRLRGRLLVYRKIVRTRVAREAREALEAYEIGVLASEVSQRVAFVESMIAGQSVLQYAPRSEAATEIRQLCRELFEA